MGRSAFVAIIILLVGCGGESSDASRGEEEGASEEEALTLRSLCSGDGTQTYEGIEGTYQRRGLKRKDEIERLVVTDALPANNPREAKFERTITRSCTTTGCREEKGTMSLLPDNAAFPNSFGFHLASSPQSPNADELYFVLGAHRDTSGAVTEICLARVVTSTDVRGRFVLKRVP